MSAGWWAPTIAAASAAALSFIELAANRKWVLYWEVASWIAARLVAHAATAAISYAILIAVFGGLAWFRGAIAIFLAAVCGPAVFRSQLAMLGSGQEAPNEAPAAAYRRILASIDTKIVDGALIAESAWVVEKAMPAIQNVPLAQIEANVRGYLTRTNRLKPPQRKLEIDFLVATVADPKASDDDKRAAIVHRLLDLEVRLLVVRLVKQGKAAKGKPITP